MNRWEWEGMGMLKGIHIHLYFQADNWQTSYSCPPGEHRHQTNYTWTKARPERMAA